MWHSFETVNFRLPLHIQIQPLECKNTDYVFCGSWKWMPINHFIDLFINVRIVEIRRFPVLCVRIEMQMIEWNYYAFHHLNISFKKKRHYLPHEKNELNYVKCQWKILKCINYSPHSNSKWQMRFHNFAPKIERETKARRQFNVWSFLFHQCNAKEKSMISNLLHR